MAVLTNEEVIVATLKLVDREGLDAISMRRVGEALGLSAMSLYHYFPSKDALLDGVFQAVLDELPVIELERTWQKTVLRRARELRRVLKKHPKAIMLFATRPAVTQASIAHVEAMLRVLKKAGFTPEKSLRIFQTVVSYVVGHTLGSVATGGPVPAYDQLDPTAFANVHRVARLLPRWDVEAEFDFGLTAMVNGFS
ncbi:MAG: TetR/AcrR family transcriptional regulator C-terminal domain-containing protein [Archangium sp.]|nr:TetR/AcrR family transcriptional regulator C-terminal domain-containing protein [Archangium sp.]